MSRPRSSDLLELVIVEYQSIYDASYIIELNDGSRWRVCDDDEFKVRNWSKGDGIEVTELDLEYLEDDEDALSYEDGEFKYILQNLSKGGESVGARFCGICRKN